MFFLLSWFWVFFLNTFHAHFCLVLVGANARFINFNDSLQNCIQLAALQSLARLFLCVARKHCKIQAFGASLACSCLSLGRSWGAPVSLFCHFTLLMELFEAVFLLSFSGFIFRNVWIFAMKLWGFLTPSKHCYLQWKPLILRHENFKNRRETGLFFGVFLHVLLKGSFNFLNFCTYLLFFQFSRLNS